MKKTILLLIISINLSAQEYTFPLRVAKDKRHLADQRDRPFLYVSDSGWLLMLGLTLPEAKEYFLRRKAQGFSVVHVFLTPTPGKTNLKGQAPFWDFDFTKVNEDYFAETEKYIALADSLHIALAVVPLWYSCCNDGWASHPEKYFKKNGTEKLHLFGQYVGTRFGKYKNIIWIMGGDNDPHDNRAEIRSLALGLKKTAPHQLITYHASSTHSSTDVWENETWLDFSMVYTYFRGFHKAWNYVQPDVYEVCYTEYLKQPTMPFVLGESTYEGEHDAMGSALQARKQAYWTMLSGGAGHSYGSPFWAVGSPEIHGKDWRKVVEQDGANTLQYLNKLLLKVDWTTLVPVLPTEPAQGFARNDYATTAIAQNKKTLVSYIPSGRTLPYDLNELDGTTILVNEYNPRTGEAKVIDTLIKAKQKIYTYTSPDKNDWVVFFEVKN